MPNVHGNGRSYEAMDCWKPANTLAAQSGRPPWATPSSTSPLVSRVGCGTAVHMQSETEGSHVSPDVFDIRQTVRLRATHVRVTPAVRVVPVGRPDGVLFLVVDDDSVRRLVF